MIRTKDNIRFAMRAYGFSGFVFIMLAIYLSTRVTSGFGVAAMVLVGWCGGVLLYLSGRFGQFLFERSLRDE